MRGAILVCGIEEIPKGEGRTFETAEGPIAVFRMHSGEVFATQAECPHLGGPLADGLTGGTTVICPLHERAFDLRTGEPLHNDSGPLKVYPVSLAPDGKVWITLRD
jgi:nitrite reductase (NADH) small subunit